MIFTEEDLIVAEDFAWKMLDGWNHAYCPNLNDYAFFYYKGKVVLDPWMKENEQDILWPNHEYKKVAVNPMDYYGDTTIESYLVRLFLLRPEWDPKITDKIRHFVDEDGLLISKASAMPVEVFFGIADVQAEEEHRRVCIGDALPESGRLYFDMMKLPDNLVKVVASGWQREVIFHKNDADKVMKILYPSGCKMDYKKLVNRCQDKIVRLIGFGD